MIFFDTETYRFRPGLQAPPIVCGQWCDDSSASVVELWRDFEPRAYGWLVSDEPVAAHFGAYDWIAVFAARPHWGRLIFDKYARNQIICTDVRERLAAIADGSFYRLTENNRGGFGLSRLADRFQIEHDYQTDEKGKKAEAWRTNYGQLDGVPVAQWPEDALRYALEDARVLREVYIKQEARDPRVYRDQFRQSRASFWLNLMRTWGFQTDPDNVEAFLEYVSWEEQQLRLRLREMGVLRRDGSMNTAEVKRLVTEAYAAKGAKPPTTGAGAVKRDRDALQESGDASLLAIADYTSMGKVRARAERLRASGRFPIQAGFEVLKETGRTSSYNGSDPKPGDEYGSFGDQMQNLNRNAGLRECYVPRPGHLLCSVDWSAAELHTLAQVCRKMLGWSDLGELLNAGTDVHLYFGAQVFSWDFDYAVEALTGQHGKEKKTFAKTKVRQSGKVGNFGIPGGLGATKLSAFAAASYGVFLSVKEAKDMINKFRKAYSEMEAYFRMISNLTARGNATIEQLYSGRLRADCRYTQACNTYFQGLAADMAKDAGFNLARECYVDSSSVLFGSRIVNFIHDEFILEVPEHIAHEATMRVVGIMEEAGRRWCPDYPVKAEPALMRRWRKSADPVYNKAGVLIPWEDREINEDQIREFEGTDYQAAWQLGIEVEKVRAVRCTSR